MVVLKAQVQELCRQVAQLQASLSACKQTSTANADAIGKLTAARRDDLEKVKGLEALLIEEKEKGSQARILVGRLEATIRDAHQRPPVVQAWPPPAYGTLPQQVSPQWQSTPHGQPMRRPVPSHVPVPAVPPPQHNVGGNSMSQSAGPVYGPSTGSMPAPGSAPMSYADKVRSSQATVKVPAYKAAPLPTNPSDSRSGDQMAGLPALAPNDAVVYVRLTGGRRVASWMNRSQEALARVVLNWMLYHSRRYYRLKPHQDQNRDIESLAQDVDHVAALHGNGLGVHNARVVFKSLAGLQKLWAEVERNPYLQSTLRWGWERQTFQFSRTPLPEMQQLSAPVPQDRVSSATGQAAPATAPQPSGAAAATAAGTGSAARSPPSPPASAPPAP